MEELEQLKQRLEAIEKSDRLQTQRIALIRRVQLICVAGIACGGLLSFKVISDPDNRTLLERVAVGAIAASLTGLIGSEFLGDRKNE